MSKRKGYVTDADVAAEIREVALGNSWEDVKAAIEAVCRRFRSRDEDKTAAALLDVTKRFDISRAELAAPAGGDVETEWWCPTCGRVVAPEEVTNDERHAVECGGCGEPVGSRPAPAGSDVETAAKLIAEIGYTSRSAKYLLEYAEYYKRDFKIIADALAAARRAARAECEEVKAAARRMIAVVLPITEMYDKKAAGEISIGQVIVITEAKRALAALVGREEV